MTRSLSVGPQRSAAAVGLNQTGRTGPAFGVGPFADVYLFCTVATLAVAAAALWLVLEERP